MEKMDPIMKHANNEMLSDKEFIDEVFMFYTDKHRKRYAAERHMIGQFRSHFKRGDSYGKTILDVIFPGHLPDSFVLELVYRQHIVIERMEARTKRMEETIKTMETQMQELIKEKEKEKDVQEFYDCHAELIQQKEYVLALQAEEEERNKRMQRQTLHIKDSIQRTDDELSGIETMIQSIQRSPYKEIESINSLKERKSYLLKQKQTFQEILSFME